MIKFQEIKVGDHLMADNDGDIIMGEVTNLNRDEKQVCVDNGVQEFWFDTSHLSAIVLNDEQLLRLRFTKEPQPDGTVKYLKGAFRMKLPADGNFSRMELWYRDEHRHITTPLFVHQLQNHYHDMTKVHLNEEVFA